MDIEGQKRLVARFLRQCNRYADGKLADYAGRLPAATPTEARELATKIGQWESYKAFNEHALGELATARLDHWFGDAEQPDGPAD